MRLVVPLLGGLVLGAAIRLLWPLTDRAIEAAERPKNQRRSDGSAAPRRKEARDTTAAAPGGTGVGSILREAELVAAKPGAPSWLYVQNPAAALLRSETFVEASITATEAVVDERCAALFGQLGLSLAREDELRRLLAEMAFARREITVLAEVDPKRPPPSRVQEMIDTSDEEHRQRIAALLGREGFARFENYFDSVATRDELRGAFLRCAALAEPLTPAQRDALVAARQAASRGESPPAEPATFLSPAQQAVFAQWEIDQVAQRKVGELLGYTPRRFDSAPLYARAKPSALSRP